jgi:hypothetical protein
MIDLRIQAAVLALGFAVAVASPALAQGRTYHPGHAARAQAVGGAMGAAAHRSEALRACNERANRYTQYTYGNMQSFVYRACMMGQGEAE